MAPDTFVIRYPGGDFEYAATQDQVPSVGEKMSRKGVVWLVTRVTDDEAPAVYVERAEETAS
jgi:hypothetical protein